MKIDEDELKQAVRIAGAHWVGIQGSIDPTIPEMVVFRVDGVDDVQTIPVHTCTPEAIHERVIMAYKRHARKPVVISRTMAFFFIDALRSMADNLESLTGRKND